MSVQKIGRPSLSIVMMVKNEEDNILRCLESVKSIADEIIIVDTGSTDETVSIIRAFDADNYALPVHIYHSEWRDDFSFHRNEGISYATGDYIFIIDADEELVFNSEDCPESLWFDFISNFEDSLNEHHCVAIAVEMQDVRKEEIVMEMLATRIFKNGSIHYERPRHNKAIFKGDVITCDIFTLFHYGYDLSPEKMKIKNDNLEKGLLKWLKSNPEDTECYFYLCQLYGTQDKFKEAVEYGEIYYEFITKKNQSLAFNFSICWTMTQSYIKLRDILNAEKWLNIGLKGVDFNSGDDSCKFLDLYYSMMEIGVLKNDSALINNGTVLYLEAAEAINNNSMSLKGGRYFFTNTPIAYATVLFNKGVSHMNLAQSSFFKLSEVLPSCPQEFVNGLSDKAKPLGLIIEKTN